MSTAASVERGGENGMMNCASRIPIQREYLSELDGLRALAIAAVFLFHTGRHYFSLGWAGVELFFVLSGFLITRILLDKRDSPFYFRNFFIRRALRIFPIYYLFIGIYGLILWWADGKDGIAHLPWYFLYAQTWPQLVSEFSVMPAASHTWTLAIEEQFYIIWPLVIYFFRGRALLAALAFAIILPLLVRINALWATNPFLMSGWLPAQVDTLGAGAAIAYASREVTRESFTRAMLMLAWTGGCLIACIIAVTGLHAYAHQRGWVYLPTSPFLVSAMACFFSGVVGLAASGHRSMRWLSCRPLVHLGGISYGMYLYHLVALKLGYSIGGWFQTLGPDGSSAWRAATLLLSVSSAAAITYLAARVSWFIVEKRFVGLKDRLTLTEVSVKISSPRSQTSGSAIRTHQA